jgi:type IV pilus assembly protein PilB
MAAGLRVTEDELRRLMVDRLEVISSEEFAAALGIATRLRVPLEEAIAERGRVPLRFILEQMADAWGVKFTDLRVSDVKPEALRRVQEDYARANLLIPFDITDDTLAVAMVDPRNAKLVAELERQSNRRVVPYLASLESIERAHLLYRGDLLDLLKRAAEENVSATASDETSPAELLTRIFEYAAVTGASDIHIEPYEYETLIRCRIDGVLREVLSAPAATIGPLAARIKALSGMRTDDRRSPQDGRFDGTAGSIQFDLRVSSLPTHWGEKIVMRVLPKTRAMLDLEGLGFSQRDLDIIRRNILRPFGMILVTGPTGSGKSTTLYAMLSRLGTDRMNLVNISTIEDPVEHPLPRVMQVSVNALAGIDFVSGLRALLRQDPDIIMVGEIRDRETAEIAVRAALVGRLLISTLHTNDSTTAIPRLIDMGVEPYLLASTLALVVAQRLVRRICTSCRQSVAIEDTLSEAVLRRPEFTEALPALQKSGLVATSDHELENVRLFRGSGCARCGGTGYRGRLVISELFEVGAEIRQMISRHSNAALFRTTAIGQGMRTMFQDGLEKALLGETTIDELIRATS